MQFRIINQLNFLKLNSQKQRGNNRSQRKFRQKSESKYRYKIIIEKRKDKINRLNKEANQISTLNDILTKRNKKFKNRNYQNGKWIEIGY
ncbi:unnamed protein product [Paramecium sonneborni]|uniref:Uncharacterized protein n=1 Tax=Paramecium sonneborni TaxID=65129 RepID=A0A8S1LI52_9CILI|nr:unnamed protein product [Paramecium sonneborni]